MRNAIVDAIRESIHRNGETVTIHNAQPIDVSIAWQSMRDGDNSADTDTEGDLIWGWDATCDTSATLWAIRIVPA